MRDLQGWPRPSRRAWGGASVALIDRGPQLGGNIGNAFVHTICGLYEAADAQEGAPRFANPGLASALAESLVRLGFAAPPERAGRVWVLPLAPLGFARLAATLCEQASPGLRLVLGSEVRGAEAGADEIVLRLEAPPSGGSDEASLRTKVRARIAIDASGDGDLAAALGADCEAVSAEDLQHPSFIVELEGVDAAELAGFERVRLTAAVARAAHTGRLPEVCRAAVVRPASFARSAEEASEAADQRAFLTCTFPKPGRDSALGAYDPLDADQRQALTATASVHVEAIVAFLAETRAGFANARIARLPQRIGVREARRVLGRTILDREHVLGGATHADEVARSSWPIELWEAPSGGALPVPAGCVLGAARRPRQPFAPAPRHGGALSFRDPRGARSAPRGGHGTRHRRSGGARGGRRRAARRPDRRGRERERRCRPRAHRFRTGSAPPGRGDSALVNTALEAIRAHAARTPDHPAVVSDGGAEGFDVLGYAALVASVERRSAELRSGGVEAGERVGLVAKQGVGFIENALAILDAGACLVPIPDGTAGAALRDAARESYLHALVHVRPGRPGESEAPDSELDFELERCEPPPPPDGCDESAFRALGPAYLRFTSGTTSQRKGVILGHATILDRLENANHSLGIAPEDRILWLLPMAHHFVVSILLYLRFGATLLLPKSSLARDVLRFANEQRASVFYASPYHYHLLSKDESGAMLGDLRLAISTADGLRAEIAERFRSRFAHPLVQALGIIEVGLPVLNAKSAATKPTALGRPSEGYDVWLRDEEGKRIETGSSPEHTGEICIRGSGLVDAYLSPWMLGHEFLEPDGFRTGDQGWFDEDGDLHLVGRRVNRINMAGMKFFAEEVEAAIEAHPGVAQCRVFAKEHAHLGEIPAVEWVPADPADPPERPSLLAHCRERLPAYKIPREWIQCDALATTATGKLQRAPASDGAAS